MNYKHYEDIYDQFKSIHGYMVDNVSDYRPKGDLGIRLTMKDGKEYDFDQNSKCVRLVVKQEYKDGKEITDERCRSSFSYHLTEWMALRGYNQQTLAESTGISKGSINSYLKQTKTPSMTNLRKIAYVLDCSIGELID